MVRYVDDTFVIWQHSTDELHKFFNDINNVIPTIKFTVEIEDNNSLPFLDVLVIQGGNGLSTTVYRKQTHSRVYFNKESNQPDYVLCILRLKIFVRRMDIWKMKLKLLSRILLIMGIVNSIFTKR